MPPNPGREPDGLTPEELEAEQATELPEREALSIVDPAVFSVLPVTQVGREADVEGSSDPDV